MHGLVIIGAGPAGISAAIYAKRSGADVLVVSQKESALQKAALIENYYGLAEPVTGEELAARGIEGARRLGVEILEEEVLELSFGDDFRGFTVRTDKAVHKAGAVIIAAGAARKKPDLEGLVRLEGHGVSYCAICDAFFFRGKKVGIIGEGRYAAREAEVLLPLAEKVTVFTDGRKLQADLPEGCALIEDKLAAVSGEDKVTGVRLENGEEIGLDGVFVARGTAGAADLGRTAGVMPKDGHIAVEENMATSVPGIFAAGDCTGGLLQVVKAAHEGAVAGLSAARWLKEQK